MAKSELTVIVALKDRAAYTFRWLAYANAFRFPFRILLADGGSDDVVERHVACRDAYPHLDYEYVRYPRDTSYTDYWTKITDALDRIDTPFVALADNDDLFVVEGVTSAVQYLQEHPDYAACGGQCAIFWVGSSEIDGETQPGYGTDVQWKHSLDARALEADSAAARIGQHSYRATHPIHYYVRRAAEFRRQAALIRDLELSDPFLIERLLVFLTATAGKTRQLESLYIARQWNAAESDGLGYQAVHGDWLGRMLASSWSRDFMRFVDAAATALADADGMEMAEARRKVIELYRVWLAPQMVGDILAEPTVTLSTPILMRLTHRLLEHAPGSAVRRLAQTLYRRMPGISPDALYGVEWKARHVPHAGESFKPIRDFLVSHAGS